ncbi:hypothetical protein V2W30_20850 [Streptomyces sp. Q6]|uniref:Uncharacterized protein n=1 Tax=Streptomyces citrinus TaxID=3118173 RepID=A0ACD5AE59_9ACTN
MFLSNHCVDHEDETTPPCAALLSREETAEGQLAEAPVPDTHDFANGPITDGRHSPDAGDADGDGDGLADLLVKDSDGDGRDDVALFLPPHERRTDMYLVLHGGADGPSASRTAPFATTDVGVSRTPADGR